MATKDAAWWRDYRAHRKLALTVSATTDRVIEQYGPALDALDDSPAGRTRLLVRIEELEGNNRRLQETIVFLDEEIVRLKRELALRATPTDVLQPVVYQPTILPPTRPDDRPIGTFGAPRPAPKPAPRKR